MSIEERAAYGKAVALVERHGMVVVTEEHMQKLLAVVEAAKSFTGANGDYHWWTEEERLYNERLKDSLAALEGNV